MPRGTNNLWVWPEKLDSFRIVTAAAIVWFPDPSTAPIFNVEPGPLPSCAEDDEQEIVDTSGFKESSNQHNEILNHSVKY